MRFCRAIRWGGSTLPEDVAHACLWLSSDRAFVTGQNIQPNGGLTLRGNPQAREYRGGGRRGHGEAAGRLIAGPSAVSRETGGPRGSGARLRAGLNAGSAAPQYWGRPAIDG